MNPKLFTWTEIIVVALVLALFFWLLPTREIAKKTPGPEEISKIAFSAPTLEAKSAYVLDVKTGKVLFEKESELQWPLASLTKLMVALAASEVVPEYVLVRITSEDVGEEGDTGLLINEEWNLQKLIDYSLIVSSNDGIRAIASVAGSQIATTVATTSTASANELFVNRMNSLARDIGLTETFFLNHSGLDLSSTLSGGYGSARDIAMLVNYILQKNPHMLEATTFSKINIDSKNKNHSAQNTNKSISQIPNVLASKTGYTELSGGNVVLAFNAGLDRPVIISVLGSSYDGRFEDLNSLVNATLKYFADI
jgi:D-alanyl-D-alanine carboxypeptidase (penicillin-binding protein 5/6)